MDITYTRYLKLLAIGAAAVAFVPILYVYYRRF
ncbi:hypothetical protein N007_15570 [Alicyclobacillus acidoterrestris ATCC 49025]|nr:hypothetical protein N007_15570 [Alicyclobacillus acidoterrestris ATCC 49025]